VAQIPHPEQLQPHQKRKGETMREIVIPLLLGGGLFTNYVAMSNNQSEIKTTLVFVREELAKMRNVELVTIRNSENVAVMVSRQQSVIKRLDRLEDAQRNQRTE
jgi:hypothetical protein